MGYMYLSITFFLLVLPFSSSYSNKESIWLFDNTADETSIFRANLNTRCNTFDKYNFYNNIYKKYKVIIIITIIIVVVVDADFKLTRLSSNVKLCCPSKNSV